ncbi:DUF5658 family protein [Tautonia plasticadhaerens]|uniref:DUF5658 domain-containing protein n=1 Tax=Tautonia plasticadhaerens TaxID=2527974 RepID=A0A518H8C6_9BACT|nr:DUF5658 family protein [Tautonia plasticadhaerens]QDV37109.1 hypothetical protein ElP_50420 [Tautonia plasticadhaerens]
MNDSDGPRSGGEQPWHGRSLLLESEISWLLLVSILDILLTTALLHRGPQFVESNPIAAWFYMRFNIAGLVAYKFGLIAAVVVIAELVERIKPGRGKFVLRVGILAASGVVVYSVFLHLQQPL